MTANELLTAHTRQQLLDCERLEYVDNEENRQAASWQYLMQTANKNMHSASRRNEVCKKVLRRPVHSGVGAQTEFIYMLQMAYDAWQCREPCKTECKVCRGTHRCTRRGVGATRRPCKLEPKQAGARMALAAGLANGAGAWSIATGIVLNLRSRRRYVTAGVFAALLSRCQSGGRANPSGSLLVR